METILPPVGAGQRRVAKIAGASCRPIFNTAPFAASLCELNVMPLERHVVLVAPEIHWNTGNIGRTCLAVSARLHLIEPLGFSLDSRQIKRAGLDYWPRVRLSVWQNFDCFEESMSPQDGEVALLTKSGRQPYWHLPSRSRLFLVFGAETRGLPEAIFLKYRLSSYYIPTTKHIRSLNLSTAAGIALYESLRASQIAHHWKDAGQSGSG